MNYGLHWFRRDLRLTGNLALHTNLKKNEGRVLGIFFFDSEFLSRPDFSANRFAFFIETLIKLKDDLQNLGGDLLVLDGGPDQGFHSILSILKTEGQSQPSCVSLSRDYEPFAKLRDERVTKLLEDQYKIPVHSERDHLLIEPHEIYKDEGSRGFYQVYSPFSRRWFEKLHTANVQERIQASLKPCPQFKLKWPEVIGDQVDVLDRLLEFKEKNQGRVTVPIPKAGELAARKCLGVFRDKVLNYKVDRDFPSEKGTSQISIYLKNGSLTIAQVIGALGLSHIDGKGKTGPSHYVKELAWREFFYHVLWHCPRVEKEAFLPQYENLAWENNNTFFEAWKEGKTGYPLVDAGMRQLNQTGWMHNRVRMVVASFLTKDLLIDWKWGERYFMEKLLDGDLAPNNGGWQWSSSTGCDPQPYFRIMNPTLQSLKYDPEGRYIKRWLPERESLSGEELHQPQNPFVLHEEQRPKALALFKLSPDQPTSSASLRSSK